MVTRDSILAKIASPRITAITVEALGEKLHVRCLPYREVSDMIEQEKAGLELDGLSRIEMHILWIIKCLVTPEGAPLFGPDDTGELRKLTIPEITAYGEAVVRANVISLEDAKKNS